MHATIGTGTNGTIDTRGPGSHGKLKEKNEIIMKKKNCKQNITEKNRHVNKCWDIVF
jgi:hypothetical protein